ncbi:MAG TPA: threonine synthase [Pontiellaceae bacterium]|nr:threonine synthase [Pontiellaceae bacterium]
MKYISTRGQMEPVGFLDAVMTGLAPDGGLLLPESLPDVSRKLPVWAGLSYQELAFEVMSLFATDLPPADLKVLIEKSYSTFRAPEVAPVIPVDGFHVLELWHGPTLAFKDVALQFLGNLFEYVLEKRGPSASSGQAAELNILGATSGDTGSAAIYGVHGKKNIRIFIMHPKGRTSPVQEKQMTSVLDDNVFNLAVEGTFDDCQHLMKSIFSDVEFKEKHSLGSVNSVNWARVLAQIVYYFYAAFRVQENTGAAQVQFAVPTGNFGDIMAGYIAVQMGLPVKRLILATNENNILSRFFNTGVYSIGEVVPTISPSMDIQVASNFERYLYYRVGQDAAKLRDLMAGFAKTKTLTVPGTDELFVAGEAGTAQTLAMIKKCYEKEGYILDPHTAVGVAVAERFADSAVPTICLATAHPAKFNDAIQQAIGIAAHHPALDKLANAETRCDTIANDEAAVRDYLIAKTK